MRISDCSSDVCSSDLTRLKSGLLAKAFGGAALFALAAGSAAAADPEITVFDWAGYEDPAFHQSYADKYGDSPTFAFFGAEEEAFQKLRVGFKADLGHPCSQGVLKWREAGLLKPLDTQDRKRPRLNSSQ